MPSLGDVLRTTPILWGVKEKFEDSCITWLVSEQAEPLLRGNKLIDRILIWDQFVPFQLMREKFDVLINLEKVSGVAALSDMIDAWTKYGFRFDCNEGIYHSYERGIDFINYINNKREGKNKGELWQQKLIEMLGVEWKGQEYILEHHNKTEEIYDVGLNYMVGSKWPTKMMPKEKWDQLAIQLESMGYKISFQQGLQDLHEYIGWINSCKTIISQDSLGVHLALALKKNLIGLYGPTDPTEIYLYRRGKHIIADVTCPYMPCYSSGCLSGLLCMNTIEIELICASVEQMLDGG
ncbi:MAG: glycosyltransferase family 9 protein [Desulfuromonadaceae bacterium]|nr:glycosyltransferase family 9 protein [Desulfuromonadaceae bacterium]